MNWVRGEYVDSVQEWWTESHTHRIQEGYPLFAKWSLSQTEIHTQLAGVPFRHVGVYTKARHKANAKAERNCPKREARDRQKLKIQYFLGLGFSMLMIIQDITSFTTIKIRVWVNCPFKRSCGSCMGGFVLTGIGGGKASLLKAEPRRVVKGIPECKR